MRTASINLKGLSYDICRCRVTTSVGGKGKFGIGKTRGIDKTFGTGGRVAEEKEEESSNKMTLVEINVRRITTVTPLKAIITQKDTSWPWLRVCLALE